MVKMMEFRKEMPGINNALLFREPNSEEWEVFFPEMLNIGGTTYAVTKLKKTTLTFDGGEPQWGSVASYDVKALSGLKNPIVAARGQLEWDSYNDRILLVLGEWDKSWNYALNCTVAKLLGVSRDFSGGAVLHSDLLALAKTASSDIAKIRYYAQASGYGGKIAGVLGCYTSANVEKSCIIKYNGAAWSAWANPGYPYHFIQEMIEPYWDGNAFQGWLTEGHGSNSWRVPYTTLIPSACTWGLFTVEPTYDPIRNEIVWTEWGSADGRVQHIATAPASAPCTRTDKTPTGSILDNEGNSLNLRTYNKANTTIYRDDIGGNTWLTMLMYSNPIQTLARAVKVLPGSYSDPTKWEVLATPDNSDKIFAWVTRAYNLSTLKRIPSPLFIYGITAT